MKKLRNKKTGDVVEATMPIVTVVKTLGGRSSTTISFDSIAELNEKWEDYKKPVKDYWYIEPNGVIARIDEWDCCTEADREIMKEIGNYFATKEEAEKAVQKLKAWKRLKDKGFKFIDHIDRDNGQGMTRYEWDGYINGEDLDLLFGGEE